MERIVPIYDAIKPAAKEVAGGTLADLLAGIVAALAGITAFGYSVLFFTRFLENDTHLWGIISAFILCFGVGAFGFTPAGLTSFIAFRAHKRGSSAKELLWAVLFILPWLVLGAILVFISDLPKIYAVPILLTAMLLAAWAIISLIKSRSLTA